MTCCKSSPFGAVRFTDRTLDWHTSHVGNGGGLKPGTCDHCAVQSRLEPNRTRTEIGLGTT